MIEVKQLAHVCIFADDLEVTRSFYRDVLGMDTQFNFLRDGKIFSTSIAAAAATSRCSRKTGPAIAT
ncbi:VOC family protein [Mesorhizobium sp.]|uniref:VOC family protein n=1 Tax=Mesorhizobium sp. TaxID=1871066 RepID=UPI00258CA621|nr:VOC family protein [Mesorhizobium sp.]